jgi:pyrimidine deaminase RibD-like protein
MAASEQKDAAELRALASEIADPVRDRALVPRWRARARAMLRAILGPNDHWTEEFSSITEELRLPPPSLAEAHDVDEYRQRFAEAAACLEGAAVELDSSRERRGPSRPNSPAAVPHERVLMELAVDQARQSRSLDPARHPRVGAVVAREAIEIGRAFRSELKEGEHAEYTLLEQKCADQDLAGSTVYTTLEPCTKRNHPKIPCVQRLIDRKVRRVVIGMLDPNPVVSGKGVQQLRQANIEVALFPADLMARLEELNRDFSAFYRLAAITPPVAPPLGIEWTPSLGMTGTRGPDRFGASIEVMAFQVDALNVSRTPVTRLWGNLRVDRTGEEFPMFLVRDGALVEPATMLELPLGRRVSISVPFDLHNPRSPNRRKFAEPEFVERFVPFTLTVEASRGSHAITFDRSDCEREFRKLILGPDVDGPLWRQ